MVDWRSEAFPRLRRFEVAGLGVTSVRSTMFVGLLEGGSVWAVDFSRICWLVAWGGLLAIAEG